MEGLLKALIPQGKKALGLWLVLFLLFFAGYYFLGPYSIFERWYYDEMHFEVDPTSEQPPDPDLITAVTNIRVQRVVADFMESKIIVSLQNVTDTTQSAVVGLTVVPTGCQTISSDAEPRVYIRTVLEDRSQNTVILEDIPPQAEVDAVFMIRIADGERGREYKLNFYVNGEFRPNTVYTVKYAPHKRLQMWIVSLFLLPPGSHILVPVVSMLVVSWIELLTTNLKRVCFWKTVGKSWRYGVGPVVLGLILTFSVFLLLPKMQWTVLLIFWTLTGVCFVPQFYDFFGRDTRGKHVIVAARRLAGGVGITQSDLRRIPLDRLEIMDKPIDCLVGGKIQRPIREGEILFKRDILREDRD